MTPTTEFVAQRAYEAFLAALPTVYRPMAASWERLPDVLKEAWKAAAAAAREST